MVAATKMPSALSTRLEGAGYSPRVYAGGGTLSRFAVWAGLTFLAGVPAGHPTPSRAVLSSRICPAIHGPAPQQSARIPTLKNSRSREGCDPSSPSGPGRPSPCASVRCEAGTQRRSALRRCAHLNLLHCTCPRVRKRHAIILRTHSLVGSILSSGVDRTRAGWQALDQFEDGDGDRGRLDWCARNVSMVSHRRHRRRRLRPPGPGQVTSTQP